MIGLLPDGRRIPVQCTDFGLVPDAGVYRRRYTAQFDGRIIDHTVDVDRCIAEKHGVGRVEYEHKLGLDSLIEAVGFVRLEVPASM